MWIKGALHVHSTFSHDGTLTIAELAQFYRSRGYRFLALGEHAQDLDSVKLERLIQECVANSSPSFCVVPGLEFACRGGLHIVGIGMTSLIKSVDPAAVCRAIRHAKGFAILAHPGRHGWNCSSEVLRLVDAAEIWNVGSDGKFIPSLESLAGFPDFRLINPELLAVAGHDFHRTSGFYNAAVETELASLDITGIMHNLRHGMYRIRAPFFSCASRGSFSRFQAARWRLLSRQMGALRQVRKILWRWSPFASA